MDLPIRNIGDLRSEIIRLKGIEEVQGVALKARFSSPSAIFGSIFSLFPKSAGPEGAKSAGFFDQDFIGLISRFVLPLTLNKTLFRHSNFLVKALVGLLSQKASHYISEDSVVSVWDKVKSLFNKTKKGKDTPPHRGVPAFSETY